MTVRLYLDIDGVLNASQPHIKWGGERAEGLAVSSYDFDGEPHILSTEPQFVMRWSPGLIDALNGLDIEIVWLTTWRMDAAFSVGPLMGLKSAVRVLHPLNGRTTFPSINWKYEAVREDQAKSPSPFIWADDELYDLPGEVLSSVRTENSVLVAPNPLFGITPEHVEQMQKLISSQLVKSDS